MTAGGNSSWVYISSDLIAPRIHAETRKNAPICRPRSALIYLQIKIQTNREIFVPKLFAASIIKIHEFIKNMNINVNRN